MIELQADFDRWLRKEISDEDLRAVMFGEGQAEIDGWLGFLLSETRLNVAQLIDGSCHSKLQRDSVFGTRRALRALTLTDKPLSPASRVALINDLRAARREPFVCQALVPPVALPFDDDHDTHSKPDNSISEPVRAGLKRLFAGEQAAALDIVQVMEPLFHSADSDYWRLARGFLKRISSQSLRPAHKALLRHMDTRLKATLTGGNQASSQELQDIAFYADPTTHDIGAVKARVLSGELRAEGVAEILDIEQSRVQVQERSVGLGGESELAANAVPETSSKVGVHPQAVGPTPNSDTEIFDIFTEEAQELDAAISETMQQLEASDDTAQLQVLKRLVHTVKGSARMARQEGLGDLAHAFENLLDAAPAILNSQWVASLYPWTDAISASIEALDGTPLSESAPVDASAGEMAEAASAADSANRGPQPVLPVTIDDQELLEIFTEEAEELLEGLDETLEQLAANPEDSAPANELKRLLHTLKGSARMAGQEPLGDLAHGFENLIDPPPLAFDADMLAALHHWLDAVAGSVTALRTGEVGELIDHAKPDASTGMAGDLEHAVRVAQEPSKNGSTSAPTDSAPVTSDITEVASKPPEEAQSIRVAATLLDRLLDSVGESAIGLARVDELVDDISASLLDMRLMHSRVREKIDALADLPASERAQRTLDIIEKTDSEIVFVSQALADKLADTRSVLRHQHRVASRMRTGVLSTRMVPFSRAVPRLRRLLRQIAAELNKQVQFNTAGTEIELERSVLDALLPSLEHMLRNAVDHGIEEGEARLASGKSPRGSIKLSLAREGGDVVLRLRDDGAGINLDRVRAKAVSQQLVEDGTSLSDEQLRQLIFHPGFSTAENLSQLSGRGVGMDVVFSEISALGGTVHVDGATPGSEFTLRLPQTGSVSRAVIVGGGDYLYAMPASALEGVITVNPFELEAAFEMVSPVLEYADRCYRLDYLGRLLAQKNAPMFDGYATERPVLLVRGSGASSEQPVALMVDVLIGGREIVIDTLGQQFARVKGVSGATISEGGEVALVLDLPQLIAAAGQNTSVAIDSAVSGGALKQPLIMSIDDSATARKSTERLLREHDFPSFAARDGVEALARLNSMQQLPDLILLDIEMPRMGGFEFAQALRHDERFAKIPIIMLSALDDEERRQTALALGAREFLAKPVHESKLIKAIDDQLSGVGV